MKKQTLKKMWVCQNRNFPPDCDTVASTRKGSIEKLLHYFNIPWPDMPETWKTCRINGWNCFKVDITFEPCSPETP